MIAPPATPSLQTGQRVLVSTGGRELPGIIARTLGAGLYFVDVADDCPRHLVASEDLRIDHLDAGAQ